MARPPAVVVVNRTARRAGSGWEPALRQALAGRYEVELREPRSPEETTAIARDAAAAGAPLVVAAGGDGTASAVAAALVGTESALGLLPLGTANDLARALGIPGDAAGAARRLAEGRVRAVDVLETGGRPLFTVGGLGIVAHSAFAVCAAKAGGGWRRAAAQALGPAVYKLSATAHLLTEGGRVHEYALRVTPPDGEPVERTIAAHGVFVANQRFLGGGLALPTGSVDDDGVFELCFVKPTPRPRLVEAFARLSLGARIPDGVLEIVRATAATLRLREPAELLGDGDAVAAGCEFTLRMRTRALRVVA